MKKLNIILSLLTIIPFFAGCSNEQIQSALGNTKHNCNYKTTVLATARNLSSFDLNVRFCSAYGDFKSIDQPVPADKNAKTYTVFTYEHKESYYDSATETCSMKGKSDKSILYSLVYLNESDLNSVDVCSIKNHSYVDPAPAYAEKYVFVDKNTSCPEGFFIYQQSNYQCH